MPEYRILSERQLRDAIDRLPRYQIGRGLSIKQILEKAWALDIATSKYVSVYKVKPIKNRNGYTITTLTREPGQGVRKHSMFIFAADSRYNGPLYLCPKVKIGCDCERWLFTFEVAMTYRGAANVIFSNGMLPLETNRGLKIGVCKHLIRALIYIVKNKL